MKIFSFRYQTLLDVRERKQKAEEECLSVLIGVQRQAEAEFARLEAERGAMFADWAAASAEGMLELETLLQIQNYLESLTRRKSAQGAAVEEATARADNQREILLGAMQEVSIMTKLKERDLADWRRELERAENVMLDELATIRHARRGLTGP